MKSERPDTGAGTGTIPSATYRLQFNRDFTFVQATAMVDFLERLGIGAAYASPLFQAGPESTHGYDICSFEQFSPTLGTRADFDRFSTRLREAGLGLVLDMVPNHMGNDLSNAWWFDVLTNGPKSRFANVFDINWQPLDPGLRGKVLLPTLEDHYATVLESGKLQLLSHEGRLAVGYHDQRFPISPESYGTISEEVVTASERIGAPPPARPRLCGDGNDPQESLNAACRLYNGQPGNPASFDRLHALLCRQAYRLSYWRTGPEQINYRRFFDVTQLVAVRMELPDVFERCHALVFELLERGQITGLRIDHPDGLWNPREYFQRLQDGYATRIASPAPAEGPGPRLYTVAEKILSGEEVLPSDWPVAGTTGYDFLNQLNGLFVDPANRDAFDQMYREFTGYPVSFPQLVRICKRRILKTALISELLALTLRLRELAAKTRYGQDFTIVRLRRALAEVIAAFPVYRTYITQETRAPTDVEIGYVEEAIASAKAARPRVDPAVLGFIRDLLALAPPVDFDADARRLQREFIMRFQQLTGPVTAKGLEDTAFYNFNRLISLNEVGGEPDRFGVTPEQFHAYNQMKAEAWPHSLLATATHDTKRGEDVRARLNVLSEIPAEWKAAVQRWRQLNADKKSDVGGAPAPHPNDEYLLYQTLVGAWPLPGRIEQQPSFLDRVKEFATKALREAKVRTTWTDPNVAYEEAVHRFLNLVLDPGRSADFLKDFGPLQERVAFFGYWNSLSQVLLKATSPGVPDFYQGTELWDLSLVDPDNRRPVDYELRRRLLAELDTRFPEGTAAKSLDSLLGPLETGAIKLFVTARLLRFRRQRRELFASGQYVPLTATGAKANHVIAFARVTPLELTITLAPRLIVGLLGGKTDVPVGQSVWGETVMNLPTAFLGEYRNVLTGEIIPAAPQTEGCRIALATALQQFPVALLERISPPGLA